MKVPTPFPAVFLKVFLIGIVVVALLSGTVVTFLLRLEIDQIFNIFEGLLWVNIAAFLAWRSFKQKEYRKLLFGSSMSFLLFGVSDFIEVYTRAWYSPPALFLLKAACVLSFIIHLGIYYRLKRKP